MLQGFRGHEDERMRGMKTRAVAAAEEERKGAVICADCRNNVSDGVSRR